MLVLFYRHECDALDAVVQAAHVHAELREGKGKSVCGDKLRKTWLTST